MDIDATINDLLNLIPDAAIMLDHCGLINYVNDDTCELFGYEQSELVGQQIEILVPDALKHDHAKWRHEWMQNPKERRFGDFESLGLNLQGQLKDGTIKRLDIMLNMVNGSHIVAVIRDLEGYHKVIDKMNQLIEKASKLNESASN